MKKAVLVGNPNAGKSVVFRLLTGRYQIVSNYSGTTVEVTRGRMNVGGVLYEVVDTPGVNTLVPQSEDEKVTCEILLAEKPDLILQIADAKNLRRTLLLTSQLAELGIPMVLILNMMDEARERGIEINAAAISEQFGIPVLETVAIFSHGFSRLSHAIKEARAPQNPLPIVSMDGDLLPFDKSRQAPPVGLTVEWTGLRDRDLLHLMERTLGSRYVAAVRQKLMSGSLPRDVAYMRQQFVDAAVERFKSKRRIWPSAVSDGAVAKIWLALLSVGSLFFLWNEFGGVFGFRTPYTWAQDALARQLQRPPDSHGYLDLLLRGSASALLPVVLYFLLILAPVIVPFTGLLLRSKTFAEQFGILTRRPSTGIPILIIVLLLLYEFVGYMGAQTLVDLLEEGVFASFVVPIFQRALPEGFLWDLLVGKYGLISMGLTYSIAIVLPIVATFFIAFGLLEDSGYLPRLSILSDRVMRAVGLNGKAVLPMVLGFGCCTMATLTTRILHTRKERLIATILLALGIPCSAQLGVILGISSGLSPGATLTILSVVGAQLLLVGWLSSRLIRGERSSFIFEIPPIRVPQLKNIVVKTAYRVRWYLREAVPLFLYGTLALFFLDRLTVDGRTLLGWIERLFAPVVTGLLDLPAQVAPVFILGFLRRDYGAAGLFAMARDGALTIPQIVVSLIVITLFVPCLASFLMIAREQGMKRAVWITAFIVPFAVAVGAVVSRMLRVLEVSFG